MQDGYTQVGAGDSDMRLASDDLQHGRQTKTADELHMPVRRVKQNYNDGGPMHHHMEEKMKHPMHQQLEEEKSRHEAAIDHHMHHLEKHQGRHYDSQYGQDTYTY